jgi:hypothetical protein
MAALGALGFLLGYSLCKHVQPSPRRHPYEGEEKEEALNQPDASTEGRSSAAALTTVGKDTLSRAKNAKEFKGSPALQACESMSSSSPSSPVPSRSQFEAMLGAPISGMSQAYGGTGYYLRVIMFICMNISKVSFLLFSIHSISR